MDLSNLLTMIDLFLMSNEWIILSIWFILFIPLLIIALIQKRRYDRGILIPTEGTFGPFIDLPIFGKILLILLFLTGIMYLISIRNEIPVRDDEGFTAVIYSLHGKDDGDIAIYEEPKSDAHILRAYPKTQLLGLKSGSRP